MRWRRFGKPSWKWVVSGLGLLLLVFLIAFLHRTVDLMRGTHLYGVYQTGGLENEEVVPAVGEPRFRWLAEHLLHQSLKEGNSVELLTSGVETYSRLWQDLRSARESITLQFYYCEPGAVADSLAAVLGERARAGVPVLFLWDSFGCGRLEQDYWNKLEVAGVKQAEFRPIHWYSLHKAQHRSHVRAVVVDGRIGYTGGFGIADKWTANSHPAREWKDINMRFTGPAVAELQGAFAAGWLEATGYMLTGPRFFPLPSSPVDWEGKGESEEREVEGREGREGREGGNAMEREVEAGAAKIPASAGMLLYATPSLGSTTAERLLALSILGAREKLYITSPYFVPDPEFRRFLAEAAGRGVDVRILTAGTHTDVEIARQAGRYYYETLLGQGVRIYEYQPAMIHGKSLVVDGRWLVVGTMNFDNRSLRLNSESSLVMDDPAVGAQLEALFLQDLQTSQEMTLAEMEEKAFWWTEILEWGASRLWPVL